MTGGSLGLRSGSYGSLQQQQPPPPPQNGASPIHFQFQSNTSPGPPRKPYKMLREKESLLHWIFKFAGRKKVGMLFLCAASALVFIGVLYVAKGEDAHEGEQIQSIRVNNSLSLGYLKPSPVYRDSINNESNFFALNLSRGGEILNQPLPPALSPPHHPPAPPPPPPPAVFLGYSLPPGHPCELFRFPPPPVDKKRTGPRPCPVCYLPVEEAIALMPKDPSPSPILTNLTYVYGDNLTKSEFGGSEFGGYPSLKQRRDTYDIRESMNVHCGFFRGTIHGHKAGFNMDASDIREMNQCDGVVVASAIFGNYDIIQQPNNISDTTKKNACFYMFVDEETEAYLKNSSGLDSSNRIGLWRIVVVHNLPYTDARRNGKVPKLLLHRIFPNARYSIWIDGKLKLVVDPYQILERFLWRKNSSFAISRHYKRFDVFVEAEANKAAGKYDNASIDFQIDFYKKEGLTPYSQARLPITSDVPEGCVIIKEHIPITNLFTCLWFNEVDRFTSRDQISFSTVRDKIMSKVNWSINMFLDCERRNFVVQAYHRDVMDSMPPPVTRHPLPFLSSLPPPPPASASVNELPQRVRSSAERITNPRPRRVLPKRGRGRRHRKVAAGSRDLNSS